MSKRARQALLARSALVFSERIGSFPFQFVFPEEVGGPLKVIALRQRHLEPSQLLR